MKTLIVCLLALIFNLLTYGQEPIVVSGEEQVEIFERISRKEAKSECLNRARINALENAFGRVIFQGNSTFIENVNTGTRVKSYNSFISIGNSFVNGEWLEDLSNDYKIIEVKRGDDQLRCKVRGLARQIPKLRVDFDAKTLDCPEIHCQTESYLHNEPFYVYFKSPESGYLAIYYTNEKTAYCMLPYQQMSRSNFPVKADTEYFLFSDKHDYLGSTALVDVYKLEMENRDQGAELAQIYVVYSVEPFSKPNNLTQNESTLPRNLPYKEFMKWLNKVRIKDPRVQVRPILVTIKNS